MSAIKNAFNRFRKNTTTATTEDTAMANDNTEEKVVDLKGEKFDASKNESNANTTTEEGNTMNTETNNTAEDTITEKATDAPKASKFGKAAKITLGVVGIGAIAGAGYLIARAMSNSDNVVVSAVGEAVGAGAEAVADATAEVVGETVAAAFR